MCLHFINREWELSTLANCLNNSETYVQVTIKMKFFRLSFRSLEMVFCSWTTKTMST